MAMVQKRQHVEPTKTIQVSFKADVKVLQSLIDKYFNRSKEVPVAKHQKRKSESKPKVQQSR